MNISDFCIDSIIEEQRLELCKRAETESILLSHLLKKIGLSNMPESINREDILDWGMFEDVLDVILLQYDEQITLKLVDFLKTHYEPSEGLMPVTLAKLAAFWVMMKGYDTKERVVSNTVLKELERLDISKSTHTPYSSLALFLTNKISNQETSDKWDDFLSRLFDSINTVSESTILFLLGRLTEFNFIPFQSVERISPTIWNSIETALADRIRRRFNKDSPLCMDRDILFLLISRYDFGFNRGSIGIQCMQNTRPEDIELLEKLLSTNINTILDSTPYLYDLVPVLSRIHKYPRILDTFWYGGALTLLESIVSDVLAKKHNISRSKLSDMKFKVRWQKFCELEELEGGVTTTGFYKIRSQVIHHETPLLDMDKKTIMEYIPRFLDYIISEP